MQSPCSIVSVCSSEGWHGCLQSRCSPPGSPCVRQSPLKLHSQRENMKCKPWDQTSRQLFDFPVELMSFKLQIVAQRCQVTFVSHTLIEWHILSCVVLSKT